MSDFSIHPYDIVMLVVLFSTTVFGLWKGMAWQVASVASFVLSFMVASQFSGIVAPYVSSREPWNRVLAMLILFLATSAAVWLGFRLVAGVIDRVKLKSFDRQIGALFGVVKGGLLCLVITFFAVTLSETLRQSILQSRSGYYITVLIDKVNPVLPEEIRGAIGQYIDELDQKLQPTPPAEKPKAAWPMLGGTPGATPPAEQPFTGQLGLDRIDRGMGQAHDAVQDAGRTLDGFQRSVQDAQGDLRRAGEDLRQGVEGIRRQVGDLRGRLAPIPEGRK